jgi:hypothetical protein
MNVEIRDPRFRTIIGARRSVARRVKMPEQTANFIWGDDDMMSIS